MNNIGKVIRTLRMQQKLSQSELAKGICTAKYLYLIEKGDRTPSNEVMGALSRKLGEDLFEFYDYLSYEDPIAVRQIIHKVQQVLKVPAYEQLPSLIEEALQLPDFHKPPLSHHITYQQGICLLQLEQNPQASLALAQDALRSWEPGWIDSPYYLRHQNLLARSHLALGEPEAACLVSSRAIQSLNKLMSLKEYQQLILSTYITDLMAHLAAGHFQATVQKGNDLLALQAQWNRSDTSVYLYFMLAFAYRKISNPLESSRMLEYGIMYALLNDSKNSIAEINQNGMIDEMLHDHQLEQELVVRFVEKFKDVLAYEPIENNLKSKKSEAEVFQSLADHLPDYLWVYNITQSRFTYVSHHDVWLRGYSLEEQLKMSRTEVLAPESMPMIETWIQETLEKLNADPGATVFYSGRIKQPCKKGDYVFADITIRCRVNQDGEIEAIGISRPVDGQVCQPD